MMNCVFRVHEVCYIRVPARGNGKNVIIETIR